MELLRGIKDAVEDKRIKVINGSIRNDIKEGRLKCETTKEIKELKRGILINEATTSMCGRAQKLVKEKASC